MRRKVNLRGINVSFFFFCYTGGEIVGHSRLRLIGDQNNGIYNLKITDASLTDDGEYQCQVGPYLRIKSIRANAHLVVICEYTTIFSFDFKCFKCHWWILDLTAVTIPPVYKPFNMFFLASTLKESSVRWFRYRNEIPLRENEEKNRGRADGWKDLAWKVG